MDVYYFNIFLRLSLTLLFFTNHEEFVLQNVDLKTNEEEASVFYYRILHFVCLYGSALTLFYGALYHLHYLLRPRSQNA